MINKHSALRVQSSTGSSADRNGGEVDHIIRHRTIGTLFQPIVEPRARRVFAYEALSRGPSNSRLHSPAHLFEAAQQAGLRLELELLCVELAATRFVAAGFGGRLFVNISPDCIYEDPEFTPHFIAALQRGGVTPDRCVIELTENALLDDYSMLRPALLRLRDSGVEVAIDDLGTGSSGLRIWSEVRPQYVKIDRYFAAGIDTDPNKVDFVRSIIDLAHSIRCNVIVEGVETEGECRQLINLGIDSLQGYLFGRPVEQPHALAEHVDTLDFASPHPATVYARQLAMQVPPVDISASVPEVASLFRRCEHNLLAVVVDNRPAGVIRRETLFGLLSKPFHLEVYNRKTVRDVMETDAILIDGRMRLDMVSQLITRNSMKRLAEEFVITENGQYIGIGLTLTVLRLITEQQVAIARHSNPLTMLPGNGPIRECIDRLALDQQPFTICLIDLDYFKPYNDVYGFAQGDQVLLLLANLLRTIIDPATDFVGHVGGDDFVLIMRNADWLQSVQRLQTDFARSIRSLYAPEHVTAGRFEAADRDGVARKFPLLSISVAALDSRTAGCVNAEAAAQMLTELKKQAKQRSGDSIVLRSPDGISDLSDEALSNTNKFRVPAP